MRIAEAKWIAARLAALPNERISPFLNIGSSTAEFREVRQPHIDRLIFAPLRARGVEVIHADLKQAPGVDVAGDLSDPAVQATLRARRAKIALSSNLLEHVQDPAAFAATIASLVEPGGTILVTVPRSYPYHADPIDTGFRPTPRALARLFPAHAIVDGEEVSDTTYGEELLGQGAAGLRKGLKNVIGALRPYGDAARGQRDRLRWLFRPFTTSCVQLEARPASAR